jgi:hypothetical protein
VSTPGVDQEPTRRHHVEGQDELTQGRFGRPLVGPPRRVLSCGGCPVDPKVNSRCPPEFEAVCLPAGPLILVTSMCCPLIHRGCFPWTGVKGPCDG